MSGAACGKCGRPVAAERVACLYCGTPTTPPRECPGCSRKVAAQAAACPYCRAVLGPGQPARARDIVDKGEAYLAQGRGNQALGLFDRAVELEPRNGAAHAGRAEALALVGLEREAAQAIARALLLAPRDPAVRRAAARLEEVRKRYAFAVDRVAAPPEPAPAPPEDVPSPAEPHVAAAAAHAAAGRWVEALRAYDEALLVDPRHPAARAGRLEAMKRLG